MGDIVTISNINDGDVTANSADSSATATTTTDNHNTAVEKDKLFDPSVEMLVNDFDDERTLEEEEALAAGEAGGGDDPNTELSSLQKESSMPLEELLALYGYRGGGGVNHQENDESAVDDEEDDEDEREVMDDEETEPQQQIQQQQQQQQHIVQPSKLRALYDPIPPENEQDASRLLRCKSAISRVSEEEEEDYDYSPDEDEWRKVNKTIMVGSDYQALIPDGLCHYDDALPYENEDKLLWDPTHLSPVTVAEYLRGAAVGAVNSSPQATAETVITTTLPMGPHLRDDEQALYLLQQCGHNVDEALRRIRVNVNVVVVHQHHHQTTTAAMVATATPHHCSGDNSSAAVQLSEGTMTTVVTAQAQSQHSHSHHAATAAAAAAAAAAATSLSLWSEEECRNFESGVRSYGKNFYLIQQNKVRTRSVGELVQFYYLWKKSERHDIFANKTRLEKKKYTLHPGLTDFMDRFLEEQDGRDRSSSPNNNTNNTTSTNNHSNNNHNSTNSSSATCSNNMNNNNNSAGATNVTINNPLLLSAGADKEQHHLNNSRKQATQQQHGDSIVNGQLTNMTLMTCDDITDVTVTITAKTLSD